MVRVRKLTAALLALSCVTLTVALLVPYWHCGHIFGGCIEDRNPDRKVMLAVASLLLCGLASLFIVFLIDVVRLCTKKQLAGTVTVRFIFIYLGSITAFCAVLVYTAYVSGSWAYFLSIFASAIVFVVQKLAMISSRCVTLPEA